MVKNSPVTLGFWSFVKTWEFWLLIFIWSLYFFLTPFGDHWFYKIIPLAAALVGLIFAYKIAWSFLQPVPRQKYKHPDSNDPLERRTDVELEIEDNVYLYTPSQLIDNIDGNKTRFSTQQILAFIAIFWSSRKLMHRAVDTYTISGKNIKRNLIVHGHLPRALHNSSGEQKEIKYMPVITIGKEKEISSFETTFNGKVVGPLPRSMWNQLATEILKALLGVAAKQSHGEELKGSFARFQKAAEKTITSDHDYTFEEAIKSYPDCTSETIDYWIKKLKEEKDISPDSIEEKMLDKVKEFVRYYSKNYVLVVYGQPKKNGEFYIDYTMNMPRRLYPDAQEKQ